MEEMTLEQKAAAMHIMRGSMSQIGVGEPLLNADECSTYGPDAGFYTLEKKLKNRRVLVGIEENGNGYFFKFKRLDENRKITVTELALSVNAAMAMVDLIVETTAQLRNMKFDGMGAALLKQQEEADKPDVCRNCQHWKITSMFASTGGFKSKCLLIDREVSGPFDNCILFERKARE